MMKMIRKKKKTNRRRKSPSTMGTEWISRFPNRRKRKVGKKEEPVKGKIRKNEDIYDAIILEYKLLRLCENDE